MTETHRVRDLANIVSEMTGARIRYLENPRNEDLENELSVTNQYLLGMGLDPITLKKGLMEEVITVAKRYADRCERAKIICTSKWRRSPAPATQKV